MPHETSSAASTPAQPPAPAGSAVPAGSRGPAGRGVETVQGPVAAAELGRVLMHEHIFVLSPEFVDNYPDQDGFVESEQIPEAVRRLTELSAEGGVATLVDPTVIGLGRYIPRIQKVALQVPVNIVVATGLYTYDAVPHFLSHRGPGTLLGGEEPLVEMFVGDITEGIADTGVKAGVLKCATDEPGLTPGVERVLRAVAQAHRATGTPILTHTHAPSRRGTEQQDVFEAEGVDLGRVVIGHCGDSTDLDYLRSIADRGSVLGMDRFGLDALLPFEQRVDTVAALCAQGYADRMVLSQDASCYIDWFPSKQLPQLMPNWHYLHVTRDVLPALRERGVTEEQITTMMVDTPRRVLAGGPAY